MARCVRLSGTCSQSGACTAWSAAESAAVCEWAGVSCGGSRVTGLDFGYHSSGRGLTRWSEKTWLSGDVGLLAGATALEEIDLGRTSVSGSVEPLAALTQLTELYLDGTSVSGSIAALAALAQLTALDLGSTAPPETSAPSRT